MEIMAKMILNTKDTLNVYLAAFCDQPIDKIRMDTDRDFYMTPEDALAYGIIDEVIQHKMMIPTPKIPELKVTCLCEEYVVTSHTTVLFYFIIYCRLLPLYRSMILA